MKNNHFSSSIVGCLSLGIAVTGCGSGIEWQEEEALGELEQPIMVGSQMDCPNGPTGACTALNIKPLIQSSDSIDVDVWDMRGGGCYDTSMSVVIQASLYNRTTTQAFTGRTLQYANIVGGNNGANPPAPTNKYYERLSQSYRWAKQSQAGVPGVTPFHFPEVLNDFTGTKKVFPVGCNPDLYSSCLWNSLVASDFSGIAGRDWICTSRGDNNGDGDNNDDGDCLVATSYVDNDYIKSLMAKGVTMMVAYRRFTPTAVQDPGLPGYRVTFNETGAPHKVVFNGYQPGTYPLRIHDVGSGASVNVTVTNDMSAISTYDGIPVSQVRKFDFPFGQDQQTFIEYDPAGGENGLVTFVEHIDYLSLGLPADAPGHQVFSGTWGSGWTTLMPFTLNGAACQLAYNGTTGAVHFDQFFANSNGASTVWSHTWAAGFTDFIPYYINGAPQFIAYNRNSGEAHFDAFPSNLQGPIIRAIRTWPTGLSSIVPFVMNDQNYLLMYDKVTGAVRIARINSTGSNTSTLWIGSWSPGFTHLQPYSIGGDPYLVAYNSTTGVIHYDRILDDLNGVEVKSIANIGAGLALSTLASLGPGSFLAYSNDGKIRTYRLAPDGTGAGEVWRKTGLTNATITSPFVQAGKDYMLAYDGASGAVRSYELTLF